jgi:hypothetical protein
VFKVAPIPATVLASASATHYPPLLTNGRRPESTFVGQDNARQL